VVASGRKRTAILEVGHLAAMIDSGTTTPFGVGIARTGIDDLEQDGRGVADGPNCVIRAVSLGLHDLKALATAQIIVESTWEICPELGVVVAIRCCKITTPGDICRICAKIRVSCAEGGTC